MIKKVYLPLLVRSSHENSGQFVNISGMKDYIDIDTTFILTEDFEDYIKQSGRPFEDIMWETYLLGGLMQKYRITLPITKIYDGACYCAYMDLKEEYFYKGTFIYSNFNNQFRVILNENHKKKALKLYERILNIIDKNTQECPIAMGMSVDEVNSQWCRLCMKSQIKRNALEEGVAI